jgi:hypothetical protein
MTLILSGTDGVSDIDGSAATPAIRGTDANTGIFFPAADTIAFSEGGVEVARFDGSGNLGIGTASPGYKLDVQSSASSGAPLLANFQAAGGDVQVYIQNGTVKTQINADATNSASIIGSFSNHPLSLRTNNTERAKIDTSGVLYFNSGYGSVATAYGCRAWLTFNGTGTIAIRASGNISSLADYGTGDYGIAFVTNFPDSNYCVVGASIKGGGGPSGSNSGIVTIAENPTVSGTGIGVITADGTAIDRAYVYAAFFR